MNSKLAIFGSTLLGVAIGATAGYFLAKKQLDKRYEGLLMEEVEKTKQHYKMFYKKEEYQTPEGARKLSAPKVVGVSLDTTPPPVPRSLLEPAVDPVAEIIKEQGYVYHINTTDQSTPIFQAVRKSQDNPYVFSVEEYMAGELNHRQVTLTYYAGDNVLADEDEMPIVDVDEVIGEVNLKYFGFQSEDPNALYVRNPRLQIDYEVIKNQGFYREIVHGEPS